MTSKGKDKPEYHGLRWSESVFSHGVPAGPAYDRETREQKILHQTRKVASKSPEDGDAR